MYLKIYCFTLIGLLFLANCSNPYNFDFQSDWTWDSLINHTNDEEVIAKINSVRNALSLSDARFLFLQLSSLKKPRDITLLSEIESTQFKSGGGFYGYVPEHFKNPERIPIPDNFENIIACADYLGKIHNQINKKIETSAFPYHKIFLNMKLSSTGSISRKTSHLNLNVNTKIIENILNYYIKRDITKKKAIAIAKSPTFQEMLRNRKELGYIPEPLPETDDLALFIYTASLTDPVSMIWKWLNPWNCFGFADLNLNSKKYKEIVLTISNNKEQFETNILNRVEKYLPIDFEYNDQLDLAVNWGILTWSTDHHIGINIIHFKDDYPLIYRYTTREIFRKIQSQILKTELGLKNNHNITIKDIVSRQYKNISDKFFIEVLTQILLDGTTAYVSGKDRRWIIADGCKYGKDLLNQIHFSLYQKIDFKTAEHCKFEGFTTNGPLIAIGYHISEELVKQYGDTIIYEILKNNYLDFYLKYIEIEKRYSRKQLHLIDPHIAEKIVYLKSLG